MQASLNETPSNGMDLWVIERDEFVYHKMIAHVPLSSLSKPAKRVLIIGIGEGRRETHLCPSRRPCVSLHYQPADA
jgi:predicted membrane-bound spermidine synthase